MGHKQQKQNIRKTIQKDANIISTKKMTESSSQSEAEDLVVIREVYDSDNAQEIFELELEKALQTGCKTIIIEPTALGEDTERWLSYGYYLYSSSLLTGLSSVFIALYWSEKRLLPFPLSFTSCLCASLYTVCWAFDPCSQYKVEKTSATKRSSRKRQISSTTSSNKDLSLVIPPVVLIRQTTSSLSNSAHLVLTLTSFTLCLWKLS